VYRQGVSFDFTQVDTIPGLAPLTRTGQFRTPWSAGVGVRIAPKDNFSFSVDYDRVEYSRLKTDYIDIQALATNAQDRLSISDANEIHAGVEYIFSNLAHPPAIRAGVWFDPNHSVQYQSDNSNSQNDVRLKAYFPTGEDTWHYTAGFGLPVSPAFEFNVATDLSSQRKYVSGSVVARFGK
jgi:long-chain fatty acid transport protein